MARDAIKRERGKHAVNYKRQSFRADMNSQKWNEQYAINFARYKELTKAYKGGQPLPVISDEEAKQLLEQSKKASKKDNPAVTEAGHVSEEDVSETSDETSSDEETPEPPKAPSPVPVAKKQKVAKETSKKKAATAKQAAAEAEKEVAPVVESAKKEKKASKKKDAKGGDDAAEARKEVAAEPASSPVKGTKEQKKKGKKRKSGEVEP